jgi:hypothetical protein
LEICQYFREIAIFNCTPDKLLTSISISSTLKFDMAKNTHRRHTFLAIDPLHPSIHFMMFLAIGLIIIVTVILAMRQANASAAARVMCPNAGADQVQLVQELSTRCSGGVDFKKDGNGCSVWSCRGAKVPLSTDTKVGTPKEPFVPVQGNF